MLNKQTKTPNTLHKRLMMSLNGCLLMGVEREWDGWLCRGNGWNQSDCGGNIGRGVSVGKVGIAFGSVGRGVGGSGGKVALGTIGIASRGGTVTFGTDGIAGCVAGHRNSVDAGKGLGHGERERERERERVSMSSANISELPGLVPIGDLACSN
ncbi:hypothetical protein RHSIM_Rhsim10G0172200 [Rhododendron simsii]|uniref:Uncharacterized protein n=1 Tax=Rhododendron simsii TaxID=118357 RepID=A0A834GB32_RHOSS|nr:hypothetical protein RHSIM_Rhsim10G0172200 [Rhododendron simsii]